MKLKHEDGKDYSSDSVTVHYDAVRENLEVNEDGTVEVDNKLQAEQLQKSHGAFEIVEEDEEVPDYVLYDKTVSEVSGYVRELDDIDRLKELREKETEHDDRKGAKQAIDDKIADLKKQAEQVADVTEEDESGENAEQTEEDEEEDGTENDE